MSHCCYSSPWLSPDTRLVFKSHHRPLQDNGHLCTTLDFHPISPAVLDPLTTTTPPITSRLSVCQRLSMCCVQTAGPHLDQWNICVVFSFHLLSLLLLGLFICCLITSHVLVFHRYKGTEGDAEWGKQFRSISDTKSVVLNAESWCVLNFKGSFYEHAGSHILIHMAGMSNPTASEPQP